ncbi:MAG: dihydrolipoamide acetyltransferase family protein [Nakamurella multipartita]
MLRLLVAAGAEVGVGDPIALLGGPDEREGDVAALLAEFGVPTNPASGPGPQTRAEPDAAGSVGGLPAAEGTSPRGGSARLFASPLARTLARAAGLDLTRLAPGSGPGGRIRRVDVQAALADRDGASGSRAPSGPGDGAPPGGRPVSDGRTEPVPPGAGFVDLPHSRSRRAIATRLTESARTVPHFYLEGTARVDALLALRRELNEDAPRRISINDLIVKAAARAHRLVPELNVIWTPQAVRRFDHVDIGVAVAAERGLVTPTLRGVDTLSIGAVAEQTADLIRRADAGRLRPEELTGGALCVTNLGMFGTERFSAIINPPQSAILAVGAAREEPIVVDGRLAVGTVLKVTVSVDHRAVDGREAAGWLRTFLAILEKPVRILT